MRQHLSKETNDDLYRISLNNPQINNKKLETLFSSIDVKMNLKNEWCVEGMMKRWEKHVKRYKDLPVDFNIIVDDINTWFATL